MRPDPRRDLPELDVEQEIDFSRYTRAIAARWWLLKLGFVSQLVSDRNSLRQVGAKIGIRPGLLGQRITVEPGPGINPSGKEPLTSLISIKVSRLPARKAIAAANA